MRLSSCAPVLVLSLCLSARLFATEATEQSPALLTAAFHSFLEGQGRWAYTEATWKVWADGTTGRKTIVQIDPSKPYAEQRTLIQVRGKPPTEQQRRETAAEGEKLARRRADQARSERDPLAPRAFHLRLNTDTVTPELDRAVVIAEDEQSVTYEVPLLKTGRREDDLYDRFQLTAQVNKRSRQFERIVIRQRASLRVKLIAKVSDGLIEIDFAQPDAQRPAFPTKVRLRMTLKVLFGQAKTREDWRERSDLRWVTPYEERFGVRIGELQTIEF